MTRKTIGLAVLVILLCGFAAAGSNDRARTARADDAITLWGVVFNSPEDCSDGMCDEDDVFGDAGPPQTAVVYIGGFRVQPNGMASFAGRVAEGSTLGALPFPTTMLYDSDAAEIHLILRSHGSTIDGMADEQITTFDGGCDLQTCEDLQFAVFRPGEEDQDGKQISLVYDFSTGQPVKGGWATIRREAEGIRAAFHTRVR